MLAGTLHGSDEFGFDQMLRILDLVVDVMFEQETVIGLGGRFEAEHRFTVIGQVIVKGDALHGPRASHLRSGDRKSCKGKWWRD